MSSSAAALRLRSGIGLRASLALAAAARSRPPPARSPAALFSPSLSAAPRARATNVFASSRRFLATSPPPPSSSSPSAGDKPFTGPPPRRRFLGRYPRTRFVAFAALSFALTIGGITAVLLVYDALTYSDRHVGNVPAHPLSLHPQRGGPKNLPVLKRLVGDYESEEAQSLSDKPHLVIVGGGWGSVALVKSLDPDAYHVTLVDPDNFFLFTPLLPSATVGTVEPRSLVEPLRKILARVKGHYLEASAVDVELSERLLEVKTIKGDHLYVPYDKLVIAVGSKSNDHGVDGLAYCHQLKTVKDGMEIRRHIMDNLEAAVLPSTTPEERRRLLSFVVCGGGPTGVEFASELYDMIQEDVMQYFPKLLRASTSVHLIQSRDHILNTYESTISEYAEKKFQRDEVDVIVNARVKEVRPDKVIFTVKKATGEKDEKGKDKFVTEERVLDTGFVLWSTGIAMNPFTKRVAELLPNQYHLKALEVDSHLRVKGAPLGTVYAVGDCSTIDHHLLDYLFDFVSKCDADKDGAISPDEFDVLVRRMQRQFPMSKKHTSKIRDLFELYDKNKDGKLSVNELTDMFLDLSSKMTSLPATAQVADQEGKYLGRKFNKLARVAGALEANGVHDDPDDTVYKPFEYMHLGSLAYISNSAVFDFGNGWSFAGGLVAMYLWRSVYWSEQVSTRTRVLLMLDWIKRGIWGRDLSKF